MKCARLLHESSSKLRLANPDIATIVIWSHKILVTQNMRSAVLGHFKKGESDAECNLWQNRKSRGKHQQTMAHLKTNHFIGPTVTCRKKGHSSVFSSKQVHHALYLNVFLYKNRQFHTNISVTEKYRNIDITGIFFHTIDIRFFSFATAWQSCMQVGNYFF